MNLAGTAICVRVNYVFLENRLAKIDLDVSVLGYLSNDRVSRLDTKMESGLEPSKMVRTSQRVCFVNPIDFIFDLLSAQVSTVHIGNDNDNNNKRSC